jgi:hypothetical protein
MVASDVVKAFCQRRRRRLLVRMTRQDRDAFAQLYDRYWRAVFRAYRILNDEPKRPTCCRTSSANLGQGQRSNPRLGARSGWAVTLTRNRAIDRLRALCAATVSSRKCSTKWRAIARAPFAGGTIFPREGQPGAGRRGNPSLEQRQTIEMAFLERGTRFPARSTSRWAQLKTRIRRGMLKMRDTLKDLT